MRVLLHAYHGGIRVKTMDVTGKDTDYIQERRASMLLNGAYLNGRWVPVWTVSMQTVA